ncbi:MAG: DUF3999 domain-containing protein [Treponema sp.]|jgi:hypothetical protein|nr:DUF3999 domain-containing protein [Treponema sp.]
MKPDKGSSFFPIFFLCLIPALSGQEAKVPKLEDFAGTLVVTGTPGGLLGLEIPEAVYRGIERPDMGDIRVFDEAGLAVPFVIRRAPGVTVTPPPEEVPFFRWEQKNGGALPGGTDITINAEGAVLSIKSRGLRSSTPAAYLLDLSGLSHRPAALGIILGNEEDLYHTGVRIYSSADLAQWREFEKRQTLAWFGGSGRESLELPPGDNRYLLLKFDKPGLSPRTVSAVFEPVAIPPMTREKTIAGKWVGENRRIIEYGTGGFYPLRAIDFPLPQTDSIGVLVKNRFTEEDDWTFVARTNLFRISDGTGETRISEALEVHSSAPYWELEAAGDLAFSSLPDCVIRWAVYDLVFLGRGAGSWTIAWGNRDYGPPGEGDLKLAEFAGETGAPEIETARPLGEPAYRPRPAPSRFGGKWGRFLLWAMLILAVVLLSGLALYITQSMKKEQL